ncbi:ABC transporter substrate-binding protein [Bhargavaea cecembensis]|uniref:ABC transporter substrate-binding protein n=1 Tax=Bhargavaea cecembensis TaxID=394098 RepID=UPI000591459C|nr:ABC transporter substrate-binding protein [Bhargavaea cecembensis]
MKDIVRAALAVLIASALLIWANSELGKSAGNAGADTITVYNWGEYIDPDLLKQFTEETGIRVVYETFDSNEAMMTKIQQGGTSYDIAVPSEYMIEKMRENDLLIPLDHSKLPNMKHLDPYFLDLAFDPGNEYSIPFFWGTLGIVFNPELLDGDYDFNSWEDLWDPALNQKVILVDSAREVIGMGLNVLGYSLNSTSVRELDEASAKLSGLAPNVKAIIGDEITQMMQQNEATVALTWSGQALDMMSENESLDYAVPEEGSNLWFDNMVIPKTAANIDGAHQFINFMLDPEVAAQNADYVGYSTPNADALDLMDPEIVNDERFYPDEEAREHLEVYRNLGPEMLGDYNERFLKFKMEMN